ncbi:hypothetical protein HXX76_003556 [Chlamydomonas incerta]|uniref:Uncharacterized protein n=1 Tax=Chlamydomonas incerta TaxID=51695 RepID=A0A835W7W2_CHLIN|nr:hypothetical protein HXX76_003556 [Chlamydomonas incerta]|eukprot:KAG2440698.1 hypothetical protein HXX76_003556 [Chlamydomonas incerta]
MAPPQHGSRLLGGQATGQPAKELDATSSLCQRSCRGLLLYFPAKSGLTEAERKRQSSLRAVEPICIGISSVYKAPEALDLKAALDAHGLTPGDKVDTAFILGHSVYQPSDKTLPPAVKSGFEFMRVAPVPATATASTTASSEVVTEGSSGAAQGSGDAASPPPPSFRFLTSSVDLNNRVSKMLNSMVQFDTVAYTDKFKNQAVKNWASMEKWLQDLRNAVSNSKSGEQA